jgi:CDP-diacylglycerol pyrophosphatase
MRTTKLRRQLAFRSLLVLAQLLPLGLGFARSAGAATDRNALWQVVNGICVRAQKNAGVPFPCQLVDVQKGYAVLGVGTGHFLVIPTQPIQGIESPALLLPGAANYWEYAWEARGRLDGPQSRDEIGLAVNSAEARTQDQLHIHLGCVRPDIRAALRLYEPDIHGTWSKLPFGIGGHMYRIMRVEAETLAATNPFQLLAKGVPFAGADMASQTIVVVGARFRNGESGFYLLNDHSVGSYAAAGEGLLDYTCAVAGVSP